MVQGLKSLENNLLRKMPRSVFKAARDAMEKGADEIVALMKQYAPFEDGDLVRSIGWTWGEPPKGSIALFQSEPANGDLRITIYAGGLSPSGVEVFWHWWQEFGTLNHPPNPFFFPAYRALNRRTKGRITRAMRKAIKQAVQ